MLGRFQGKWACAEGSSPTQMQCPYLDWELRLEGRGAEAAEGCGVGAEAEGAAASSTPMWLAESAGREAASSGSLS